MPRKRSTSKVAASKKEAEQTAQSPTETLDEAELAAAEPAPEEAAPHEGQPEQTAEPLSEALNGVDEHAEMIAEAEYQAAVREIMDSQPPADVSADQQPEAPAQAAADAPSFDEAITQDQAAGNPDAAPMEPERERSSFDLRVQLRGGSPVDNIAATADVEINGICTIRNVKIRNDDYGLEVVMPRTKMPDSGRFKDACVFATREMRSQFDMAVLAAYQQQMDLTQEQSCGQAHGMGMRM